MHLIRTTPSTWLPWSEKQPWGRRGGFQHPKAPFDSRRSGSGGGPPPGWLLQGSSSRVCSVGLAWRAAPPPASDLCTGIAPRRRISGKCNLHHSIRHGERYRIV